jgi:hypothetical protein
MGTRLLSRLLELMGEIRFNTWSLTAWENEAWKEGQDILSVLKVSSIRFKNKRKHEQNCSAGKNLVLKASALLTPST